MLSSSSPQTPPIPYPLGAKLFLENLLLGFVESAAVLLPSAITTTSSSSSPATNNNNDDSTPEYYENLLRSILSTVFQQGFEHQQQQYNNIIGSSSSARNHKQKTSLIIADHDVVRDVTLPAAKLAAYPVNEARLVPSVLIPSVETLRHVLRQRLSDLGITGIATDGTSASSSTSTITTNNSNKNNNNSFVTTDAIITIARSLSCAAFFLDHDHDENDGDQDEKRIHRFKTLTTVIDEIFVEEDFSKRGNFDAKRLGRVFDFFWCETLSSVSSASSSSTSTKNQMCLLNSIIGKSTPWRLALQLFVEDSSASSFFAPHSFERFLNSELTMFQKIVSNLVNDQQTPNDENEANNNNNWITLGNKLGLSNSTLATVRAVFLVLVFGSTDAKYFTASLKLLAKNNASNNRLLSPSSARIGKQDSENSSASNNNNNNQKSAGQRLVRFAIDRIFVRDEGEGSHSMPANLSQVIVSLLIQFSEQHEPTFQNNYLIHSLIERSHEHKDKIEQLLFNNHHHLHHHQNNTTASSFSLSQKLFTSSAAIFSSEVFKDLCFAVSTNTNNNEQVCSSELPAANTLPALIADAFVEEINQSSNHEDCVKTMRRIANLFNEGNYDEDVDSKNENSIAKSSSLRPIALVFASRVYLSPDGCIEFFRNTTSVMTQGVICAENHMNLLSSIISSLEGFMKDFDKNNGNNNDDDDDDDDQESLSQNKNIETKFLVMSVLRHLKVTWELAKAFDEVNAEALDMTNNNNSFSQLAMTNMSGFYGTSAFKRIMKPIVSVVGSINNDSTNSNSTLLSSHGSSWLLCYLLTSRNNMMNLLDNYSCDLVYRAITVASSQLGLLSSSSHFWQNQQQTILNDQYKSNNNNNNNNINNNSENSQKKRVDNEFYYEGLLQLVDLSRALSGERVVVSCAVSLQRLSKVSVLIDVSSSIMTEVSQSLELLQQQKSASNYNPTTNNNNQQLYHNNINSLPTYITCQDLVDAIVTTVVSLLLQPFFAESITTDNETILARRCTAFKNIWSQIQAQVKRSGFELSGGVVRAAQQALGRVSLVSKLPTGPLRRSIMISDTAELLLRAAESGAEEVVRALLSTLCAKDQEDDESNNNKNDPHILLDSTIEEAFATWHLQRDLTPTSLFGNAPSSNIENPPPLLLASEFLGAGDVVLSILRRASTTNFFPSTSASLGNNNNNNATSSEKFSSSLVSSTNNNSSSSLITEDVISSLLHQLVRKSKIQSLQNIVAVALDMNKAKKTKNEMIMNPMTGSPSSATSSSSSQITFKEMYRRICDPFLRHELPDLTPALETQYEAVSILSPQRSRVTSFRQLGEILAPMLDSGLLTKYVWKGYFYHNNNNNINVAAGDDEEDFESSSSSSPLSCLIEHIVSCVGSIEKLSGGEQILNEENVVFSTTEESLEDLVKKLHAAFIKAVISSKSSTTTSICWTSADSSSQEPQKRCLSPFSILLLLLQHLDSVLKENVEEFFATNNNNNNINNAKSQILTSTSRQKDDVSPLFQLGAKCIDELAKATPSSTSTSSSNVEPLAVGLLRRIGALSVATATATPISGEGKDSQSSSSSSSSLLLQVKNHFCNNVLYNSSPIIQSQIILIERRIQVQQKFFACTKECEVFGKLCIDDESKKKEDPKYRNTFTTETTEKIKAKMSSFSPEASISVLSPVTSILFMLMPGVAQNEIAPSWLKILTRQILDLFEIKTAKHHQSILSLCDTMVPFADLIQWCPSAFFASARSLEAFDSSNSTNTHHLSGGGSNNNNNNNSSSASTRSGDVLRLHCCLALCLASLSKNLPKNNNEGNEEDIKIEYIKLAHAFLKQLTFPDYFVEIAIPGKSSLGIIHHNNHFASKEISNSSMNNANNADETATTTTRTTYLLERVLKACGRAVHVAFPVELLLTLYKDVISMNPSLLNFAQQAVSRTKRFGTLRSTIQKCVDETMKEDQLSQQVRELDFSAFPPSLLATLRRQLLLQRQFDTLVALFEEVIQAEPEKQTLETATEGLCITHSQKIVFAFLYCKMVNKKNAKLNDGNNSNSNNNQQQDPGFAALQTFSSLHRNLYQNCSGEMELQKGSFLSGNMIQTRVVSLVLQGCQEAAAKHEKNINSNLNLNARASNKNTSSDEELFAPFPDEIFELVDQPDWFNIAFRLLTFVTESSSLRKYFVADPKWKRSLLGIATMRALLSVNLPPSSIIATPDNKNINNNNNNNSNPDQQQEKPLSSLFSASIFMKEPMLVIENLIMCCHTNEAAEVLKCVPTLNCDELVMDYALRAVSVQGLTELDDDLFPFGCRVSGVEANEEGVLFPLDTQLTLRLKPDQSAMVRERTRENFKYSRNPLVFLHCAIATLCRDTAFRFKRCFDFAVALYDQIAASCDRPPFQDLLVDLGARVLASATDAAVNAGVFQDDASLAHDASLLAALFHVARVMLLAGEEKFHTFDRFQDPSTRAMAVKDLVFDLLDAGLTSAASHIALSTAGLVKGLDAIWLADATRLASLGLIDEASAAISRLDGSQGARSDTAQILIPLIEHSASAGLIGCYGAVKRDVFLSGGKNTNNNISTNNNLNKIKNANNSSSSSALLSASAAASLANIPVQQKYLLARPESLEICDRNKVIRESVVGSLVKEFTGIPGTIKFMVRQNKIQETVRVALTGSISSNVVASPKTVVISASAFANSVFFDNGLLMRPEIHGQLRQSMKRVDPTLVLCRPFIEAVVDKLATVAPPKEASPNGPTPTTILLQFQLDWMTWSHDHSAAGRIAIALAAESPDYLTCLKFVDVAEEHSTLSKLQPTYVEPVTNNNSNSNNNNGNDDDDVARGGSNNRKNNNIMTEEEDEEREREENERKKSQQEEEQRDPDAFAADGTKYPPCKMDVMQRLDLLGRLRFQRALIKLLADCGPKVQLGWYDVVQEENLLESVKRLVASQYRNSGILDVCVKALTSISHPTAPLFTTALRSVKETNRNDMALAFATLLVGSPALSANDRDATLLECIRYLGPTVITDSPSAAQQKIIKEVDAAVDAISSDNYSYRCGALLACGRLQDAYRTAAVEAQSVQLVQEVASKCQTAPLNKLKQSKQVVEMCMQYVSFARGR